MRLYCPRQPRRALALDFRDYADALRISREISREVNERNIAIGLRRRLPRFDGGVEASYEAWFAFGDSAHVSRSQIGDFDAICLMRLLAEARPVSAQFDLSVIRQRPSMKARSMLVDWPRRRCRLSLMHENAGVFHFASGDAYVAESATPEWSPDSRRYRTSRVSRRRVIALRACYATASRSPATMPEDEAARLKSRALRLDCQADGMRLKYARLRQKQPTAAKALLRRIFEIAALRCFIVFLRALVTLFSYFNGAL